MRLIVVITLMIIANAKVQGHLYSLKHLILKAVCLDCGLVLIYYQFLSIASIIVIRNKFQFDELVTDKIEMQYYTMLLEYIFKFRFFYIIR